MFEILIPAFITLFVIIDPVGLVPIFAVLTEKGDRAYRHAMALKGTLVAAVVLFTFAIFGDSLLGIFGVSMPAFRIAGGLLLFMVSLEMVFDHRSTRRSNTADEFVEAEEGRLDDISVFPLGIPFIAGPGSITSVILIMGHHQGEWVIQGAVLGVVAIILLSCYLLFILAVPLMRLVGPTVASVITRLLGVITAAISVQFIIDGLKASFGL